MEQNEPNDTPAAGVPGTSLGRTLREARERLSLSVADVAGQLKFAPRQIEALEADDFQRLPEMTFVRGFVRSYARILQLDAQPLLAALPEVKHAAEPVAPASVEVPFPMVRSMRQQNLIWLAAALLIALFVAGFALWHSSTPQPAEAEPVAKVSSVETPLPLPEHIEIIAASPVAEAGVASSVAAASTVAAVPPAQSSVAAVQPTLKLPVQSAVLAAKPLVQPSQPQLPSTEAAALRLVFDDESWTEIKDKFGKTLSSQINPRGSELRVDGRAPFSLVIGHAAAVRVYLRGKQVGLTDYINSSSEVARLTLE